MRGEEIRFAAYLVIPANAETQVPPFDDGSPHSRDDKLVVRLSA